MTPATLTFAEQVLEACRSRGLTLATAESCTGGLVAAALTSIPGASDVVERGFVTYSNEAKTDMLMVDADLIARAGAVSKEVALAMAVGALAHSRAGVSVAVTGVAGPGGGTQDKPVGLVHFAAAKLKARLADGIDFAAIHHEERFGDIGRAEVRDRAVDVALRLVLAAVGMG